MCESGARFCYKISAANWLVFTTFALFCQLVSAADVRLYAAVSLSDALTELSALYEKSNPQISIKKSFSGSSVLAKQIENGAPADIFISADSDWEDYLLERDLLLSESRKRIAANELVLIAPAEADVKIVLDPTFNFGAAFNGKICTGDPSSVPAGKYAKQSLSYYGWWEKVSSRVVGAEDVRTALRFVERGECVLGVVYKTDAYLSKKVKVVATVPNNSHSPIEYPGALTKNATAEAKAFFIFLHGDEARAVFNRYGFASLQ